MGIKNTSRLRLFVLPQVVITLAAALFLAAAFQSRFTGLHTAASTQPGSVYSQSADAGGQLPTVSALDSLLGVPAAQSTPSRHSAPPVGPLIATVAPPPSVSAVDCNSVSCIALSFDDGPNAVTTPQVLSILEQEQVTATFFLIGKNIGGNESLVQRMAKDEDEIGNHTWSHMDMTHLTRDQIRQELLSTQASVIAAGGPIPTLFRPPYGAVAPKVVASAGLQTALWNEDPRDWQATDPAALQQQIITDAKPGGVVDLHDIHPITVSVLAPVIDALKAQGFHFVTVSQLQHSRPRAGHAPFYGYEAGSYAPQPASGP